MPPLAPIFRKAYITLALSIALYAFLLFLLTFPAIQRHVIYVDKLQFFWQNVDSPEQFGFAQNQVTPFNIYTPDHETLYAWHVLPIGLYAKSASNISTSRSPGFVHDFTQTEAFRLIRADPEARLVIEFHGNTNHVAQGWRTESYKALASVDPNKIHVLAIDYRGFGRSTGIPSEQGLLTDATSTLNFAIETLHIPPSQILLLGQSLGTAVATSLAHHHTINSETSLAGLLLIAPFTSIPSLLPHYRLFGYVPLLSPLLHFPTLSKYIFNSWQDKWDTASNLEEYILHARKCRVTIVHAKNDGDIPWQQSQLLFERGAMATTVGTMEERVFQRMKERNTVRSHDGGFTSEWRVSQNRILKEVVLAGGGHNRIMTYPQVAIEVWRAFGLDAKDSEYP